MVMTVSSQTHLLLHPGQGLPDVDERGPVGHAAAPLLHLGLHGLQLVGDLAQQPRPLGDAATDLKRDQCQLDNLFVVLACH